MPGLSVYAAKNSGDWGGFLATRSDFTMTAPTTIMITATGMDTVTVTTAMPTMTEISATGTALTTIICLRVWPNAIIFLPD